VAVGIGFSLQKQYNLPIAQVVSLLKENGFCAVSPLWTPELDIADLASCVKAQGMVIQSLHATQTNITLLWKPEEDEALSVFQKVIKSIDDCARFGITTLVIHGWQGLNYSFPEAPLNFSFFDKIVQYAETQGVLIAFENLEGEEYLDALMSRYLRQSNVGFCWDSGHDNCYPHKIDFLKKFGDRLIMTHLHDNFGLRDAGGVPHTHDDLHLLPYDGTIQWDKLLCKLQKAKKQDILNFELKTLPRSKTPADLLYINLSLEDFIKRAAEKARLVAEKYAENLDT